MGMVWEGKPVVRSPAFADNEYRIWCESGSGVHVHILCTAITGTDDTLTFVDEPLQVDCFVF